jgi:hypothetical protein
LVGTLSGEAAMYREAQRPATPISQTEAASIALTWVPKAENGFGVVAAQLEPSSKHWNYVDQFGPGVEGEGGEECLILPPTPLRGPCRYFPVWIVHAKSNSANCDVYIEINALTGRFLTGQGNCAAPGLGNGPNFVPDIQPFQPLWNYP